jgi:hypothetical protein
LFLMMTRYAFLNYECLQTDVQSWASSAGRAGQKACELGAQCRQSGHGQGREQRGPGRTSTPQLAKLGRLVAVPWHGFHHGLEIPIAKAQSPTQFPSAFGRFQPHPPLHENPHIIFARNHFVHVAISTMRRTHHGSSSVKMGATSVHEPFPPLCHTR